MLALMVTFVAAFVLYAIKYDTRKLEQRVERQSRLIERTESDIRVLQAERAHLARPQRIEALARRQGLRPIDPAQYGRIVDQPFSRARRGGGGHVGDGGHDAAPRP